MLSSRSFCLARSLQRCGHLVRAKATDLRLFSSPAVKRFRQKQQLQHTTKARSATMSALPHSMKDMDNHTLLTVAALENHDARIEVLKRHIMTVDHCSHDEAIIVFREIAKKNREGMALAALPYKIGIFAGIAAAIGSIPLVFDLQSAMWFNEYFVTTEVPGSEDLETALEVGAWAWNWMEPPLGTLSFALLSLQFSRAQMENLGIRPYTSALKKRRGRNLAACFPRYDAKVIMEFSETDPLMKLNY